MELIAVLMLVGGVAALEPVAVVPPPPERCTQNVESLAPSASITILPKHDVVLNAEWPGSPNTRLHAQGAVPLGRCFATFSSNGTMFACVGHKPRDDYTLVNLQFLTKERGYSVSYYMKYGLPADQRDMGRTFLYDDDIVFTGDPKEVINLWSLKNCGYDPVLERLVFVPENNYVVIARDGKYLVEVEEPDQPRRWVFFGENITCVNMVGDSFALPLDPDKFTVPLTTTTASASKLTIPGEDPATKKYMMSAAPGDRMFSFMLTLQMLSVLCFW